MGKAYGTVYRRPIPDITYLPEDEREGFKIHAMYRCVDAIRRGFTESYVFSVRIGEVKERIAGIGIEVTPDFIRERLMEKPENDLKDIFGRRKAGVIGGETGRWDTFYGMYLSRLNAGDMMPYETPLQLVE